MPNAFATNDPPEPNLPIELLTPHGSSQSRPAASSAVPMSETASMGVSLEPLMVPTMAQSYLPAVVAPPNLPSELLVGNAEPVASGDWPSAPDLPAELWTRAVAPQTPGSAAPAPDIPDQLLLPSEAPEDAKTVSPGPGPSPVLLEVQHGVSSQRSDPPGPDLVPGIIAPSRLLSAETAHPGPHLSTPLSPDVVVDEMSFEEKWADLSRRLTSARFDTDSSDSRIALAPDLPPEFLQPRSDSDEMGGDSGHNDEA